MDEWSMRVTRPLNRVWKQDGGFLEGLVVTEHGIVYAYSQGGSTEVPSTNVQFVWAGRLYSRSIDRRYSARGLITIANRFAAEIAQGASHDH